MKHHLIIIEVSAVVDFEDLDPDDLNEDGQCSVDGSYAVNVYGARDVATAEEAALDKFHEKIGIASLDDYMIVSRAATDFDTTADVQNMHGIDDVKVLEPQDDTPGPG
jgi:hypothetical protein